MARIPVNSSNIASVGYDAATSSLQIEFLNGKVYEYYEVPESEFDGLVNAGSPGGYFHANIKNIYSYAEI
ncbi:KTSC domain-containing protein [Pseudomonas poae]|uniref:KTSC domain-containing protein n=1 Tax=Pseudomonas poae TaxID=200451 RepID=A0ABY0S0N3_9PSED|nr:KTSC domain-containing protein [Pseudomonas poae]NMZ49731.1 KTSC domain-containing protein [Pseudomonas poae]SDO68946.1 KTSC domain-containing protein [Pseudomonas poae]